MTSRRLFLPMIAGGLATARRLLTGAQVCTALNYVYSQELEQLDPAKGRRYRFHFTNPLKRPLWSCMSSEKRQEYAGKIQRGYQALIARSLRHPADLGGLVGQGWIHHHACDTTTMAIHSNSAFLPWHRAFLYFHERWLQHALGDRDFRIMVWDWENDPKVPHLFGDWLKIPGADCTYLARNDVDPISAASVQGWLLSHCFLDFAGAPNTGATPNAVWGPHSNVHTQLAGLMKDPRASALHPIFYSHHANVDRYWCAWWNSYSQYGGFKADFPDTPWFFRDPEHGMVRVYASELMETGPLGYQYELPATDFYQPTRICAATERDFVSVNPVAFFGLLLRLAGERRPEVSGFPVDILLQVIRLTDIVLQKFPKLALPLQMELSVAGIEAGMYYPVKLTAAGHTAALGGVGIFARHDHGRRVACLGSIKLEDLKAMWPEALSGMQVSLGTPGSDISTAPGPVNVLDFGIMHPVLDQHPDGQELNRMLNLEPRR
jgi:hypothetical protein